MAQLYNTKDSPTNMSSKLSTNVLFSETKVVSDKYREREKWSNKYEFILASMSYAIGLGSVWRFPYLCYKNGGGAFLIPYFIFLVFGGIPILFLEVAIGQYFRSGGISVWTHVSPVFKGIGLGSIAVNFIVNCYYIVTMSWTLLYFYHSFSWVLPWSTCDNDWNTINCWSSQSNRTIAASSVSSVTEFWERKITQISAGIDQPNGLHPGLTLTLFIVWAICFFCIWKGIKSTGKAVYVSAIFPYFILTVLFIRGLTLPGAFDGIRLYLAPDFSRLGDPKVWIDAATQVFFSFGLALGCMTALGSYNRFNNNFHHQLFSITGINVLTSLFSGFVVFSVIGFMAHEEGKGVSEVVKSGTGLAFLVFPQALAQMPGASAWAVLFFAMLLLLGLGSQFVCVEAFITAVVDVYPKYLRYGRRREWFIFGTCLLSFLIGLSMVTRGGMYVFVLLDNFGASGLLFLWICFFQVMCIGWVYNADRLYDNIEGMIGFRMSSYFKLCWKYITPALIVCTFAFFIFRLEPISYFRHNERYDYPVWVSVFGWFLLLGLMAIVPIYGLYIWFTTPYSSDKLKKVFGSTEMDKERIDYDKN